MNTALQSLAEAQNHLLARIFAAQTNTPSRGLTAYRANAQANAQRALQAAYPVLAQLLGLENFTYLAQDFWHHHPPQRGDLAQWGHELPAFLAASQQLAYTPYLADVATIEWALHTCAHAADIAPDLASFAALTQHAPEALTFLVAPGAQVLHSAYPAAAITLAHLGYGTLEQAGDLLRTHTAQTALVWRQGYAPRLSVLAPADIAFTQAVCAGKPLGSALACAASDFDLSAWLTARVHSGFVLGLLLA